MANHGLSLKAINRATLARQMLLSREKATPLKAIEKLVGLQAQEARPPFIGLWTRIENFERPQLAKLLHARKVIRATAFRATIHLMSAKDFVAMRPTMQPVLTSAMQSALRDQAKLLEIDKLVEGARTFFDEAHRTFDDLRKHYEKAKQKANVRAMAYAVRTHLPLVQVPTDDPWAFPSSAAYALADTWLGKKIAVKTDGTGPTNAGLEALVLRYLAAFGPAAPADVQTWSLHKNLGEVFERLRPKLKALKDPKGREIFDLPKAPRPDESVTAPVRFLPEYDNLVLSHADRTRVIADAYRPQLVTKNLRVRATFLIDGFAAGTWKTERGKAAAKLTIEPFEAIPKSSRKNLIDEAERLLRFIEPDAARFDVSIC